jgi:hypothetical protein
MDPASRARATADAKMVASGTREVCMGGALAASEGSDASMPTPIHLKVLSDEEIDGSTAEILELPDTPLKASDSDSVVFAW